MKRPPVIHPFLFGLSPILFLYAHNLSSIPVSPGELLPPVLITLGASAALWLVLSLILGNRVKAGLIVSPVVLLFFLYGHVFSLLDSRHMRHEYLLIAWALLLAIDSGLVIRTRRSLNGLTATLNIVSAAILVTNLVAGLPGFLGARGAGRGARAAETRNVRSEARDPDSRYPDIYYIILDTYARTDFLKANFGYDNSDFIDYLTGNGFYVVPRGRSNYAQTYLSIASSLNYTYLDSLAARVGVESDNRTPPIRMIEQSRLVDFLKRRGYTAIGFSSGYTGTDLKNADVQLVPRWALSEFQNILLSTTILPAVLDPLIRRSPDDLHRERVLQTIKNIPIAGRGKQPVFVFAHILSPHPPFVFGAHGERVTAPQYFRTNKAGTFQMVTKHEVRKWYEENYRPQITYLTQLLEEMVSRILAESPASPVIILQSDHGPGSILNWDDPDPDQLPERHAILNAIRLPPTPGRQPPTAGLYDSITPVNTFRFLLPELFDTSMALLKDKSYFSTMAHPYRFYDIDAAGSYPGGAGKGEPVPEVSVVAFPVMAQAPENPALYCRRLVLLKYRRQRKKVATFYVKTVKEPLTAEQAFALYQESARKGDVPDFGSQHESFSGLDPERNWVVALYFPTPERR